VRRLLGILLLSACGGGGGGDNDPPPPPPPPYAETVSTGLAVGLAYPNAATIAPYAFIAVSESEMGADLNGDGDQLDDVLHEIETAADAVRNTGLAVAGKIVASDVHVAFLVSESGQAGSDFNGDGDSADLVWFVYDPARPFAPGTNPVNTALAAPVTGGGAGVAGGFVLLESEASARADRNGDGDRIDIVPRAFDGAAFAVSPLAAPAQAPGAALVGRNGRVLYAASEPAQGAGLNGDGDQADFVLFAIDFKLGTPTLRPVGAVAARAVGNHPYALSDGAAVYYIDEAQENAIDLNNDADMNDAVIAVFDLTLGVGETLPSSPLIPSLAVAGATTVGIGAGSGRVIVAVSEAGQKRDLNNDFDQVDLILAWIDTNTPATLHVLASIALAAQTPVIDGTRGLVAVSEGASGFQGTDLNLDGDKADMVLFLVDTVAGTTTNFARAIQTYALVGVDAFVGVDEAAQAGGDLNGNGIATDVVQFYIDLGDPTPAPRGLGIIATAGTFFRLTPDEVRVAAILPEGQSAIYGDLNGDGDTNDSGLELFALDPSLSPPPFISPTPFFAGECSAGVAQPLRTGDGTFVFPTSESMAGADLNGDADLLDTVLCITRIQ